MFRMLAPHLLPFNKPVEVLRKQKNRKIDDDYPEIPLNKLDPNVFKCLPRAPPITDDRSNSLKSPKKKKPEREKPKPKFQRKPLYSKKTK